MQKNKEKHLHRKKRNCLIESGKKKPNSTLTAYEGSGKNCCVFGGQNRQYKLESKRGKTLLRIESLCKDVVVSPRKTVKPIPL